jgi:hypothetical protein
MLPLGPVVPTRIAAAALRLAARALASRHSVSSIHRPESRFTSSCVVQKPSVSPSHGTAMPPYAATASSMRAGSVSSRVIRTPDPGWGRIRQADNATSYCSTDSVPVDRRAASAAIGETVSSLARIASAEDQ